MDVLGYWAVFYASVVSMEHHPGKKNPKSLSECGAVADAMLDHCLKREELWRGSQPSLVPSAESPAD